MSAFWFGYVLGFLSPVLLVAGIYALLVLRYFGIFKRPTK